MKNQALLRSAADNRARSEIAKLFEVYTYSLMKDYAASTSAGGAVSEEQHIEQAIETVTSATLSGVEIIDRWQDPGTGEFYSLAVLYMGNFVDGLNKVKGLDGRVKDYIRQNADRLHTELEKERDGRR